MMLQLSWSINLNNHTIAGSLEAASILLPKINNFPAIFNLPWGIQKEICTKKMIFPKFQSNETDMVRHAEM